MLTGAALQRKLQAHFLCLNECVRNRKTGLYTLAFYYPGWQQAVPPADQIVPELIRYLNAQVVSTYQVIADWRPNHPIICSQVTLRLLEAKPAIIPRERALMVIEEQAA